MASICIAVVSTLFLSAQIDQFQQSALSYATVQVVEQPGLGIDKQIDIAYTDGQVEEIDLGGNRQKRVLLINGALNRVAAKGYHLKQVTQTAELITVYTFEKNN